MKIMKNINKCEKYNYDAIKGNLMQYNTILL